MFCPPRQTALIGCLDNRWRTKQFIHASIVGSCGSASNYSPDSCFCVWSITPRARGHADFPLRGFVKCGYCTEPLTGSWSKGRNRYYAYYHCQDGCIRATKDSMEQEFETFMRQLQPNAGYMRLYREIVLDVWRKKQGDSQKVQGALSRKVKELRENKTNSKRPTFIRDPLTLRRIRVCAQNWPRN